MLNKSILFLSASPLAPAVSFPTVTGPTVTAFGADTTDHLVNLPTVASGDGLIFIFGALYGLTNTVETPAGVTLMSNDRRVTSSPRYVHGSFYKRVADGTEGTTLNFVTSVAATAVAHVYRVQNWFGSLAGIEVSGGPSNEGTSSPNPPSTTASWGARSNAWIAAGIAGDDDIPWTAAPANYTNLTTTISGGGGNNGCSVGSAHRLFYAAADDPGPFTITSNEGCISETFVVRPAA